MRVFTRARIFFAGYDTYERHRLVSSLVDNPYLTIIDVGGRKDQLSSFCDNPVTVVNLQSGDILANGLNLPFPESSFDIVVSLDVLEHVPKHDRARFIEELLRVAGKKAIICTPFGSIQHERVEREVLEQLAQDGIVDEMLSEHVKYGLPTDAEILEYIPAYHQALRIFSGDYRFNLLLFKIDHWLGSRFRLLKAGISLFLNLSGNVLVYPNSLSNQPSYYSNRITVVINK